MIDQRTQQCAVEIEPDAGRRGDSSAVTDQAVADVHHRGRPGSRSLGTCGQASDRATVEVDEFGGMVHIATLQQSQSGVGPAEQVAHRDHITHPCPVAADSRHVPQLPAP